MIFLDIVNDTLKRVSFIGMIMNFAAKQAQIGSKTGLKCCTPVVLTKQRVFSLQFFMILFLILNIIFNFQQYYVAVAVSTSMGFIYDRPLLYP